MPRIPKRYRNTPGLRRFVRKEAVVAEKTPAAAVAVEEAVEDVVLDDATTAVVDTDETLGDAEVVVTDTTGEGEPEVEESEDDVGDVVAPDPEDLDTEESNEETPDDEEESDDVDASVEETVDEEVVAEGEPSEEDTTESDPEESDPAVDYDEMGYADLRKLLTSEEEAALPDRKQATFVAYLKSKQAE